MPTFDFNNESGVDLSSQGGTNTITASNEADGVLFTVSSFGASSVIFYNSNGGALGRNLGMQAETPSSGATLTLNFQSLSNTSLTLIEGVSGSAIVLDLGTISGGAGSGYSGTWMVTFLGANGFTDVVQTVTQGVEDVSAIGQFSGIRFTISGARSELILNEITVASLACFCAGTQIAVPGGAKPVETLKEGDILCTAEGGTTRVRWLGQQTVRKDVSDPALVNPICISAGAVAPAVPERDLWVSQDHAVEIGGVLYTAGALLNGESIYQVRQMPSEFMYYHVETDGHDLILAEGLSAETYIDYLAEGSFDNLREARLIPEMNLPRVSSARLMPRTRPAVLANRVPATA